MRYSAAAFSLCCLGARRAVGAHDARLCDDGGYTSPGGTLTYVPNAWNPDRGFTCIAVRDSPPSFDATWKWLSDPWSVHSYPHVKFTHSALPVSLSDISALELSAEWAMGPGSTPPSAPGVDSPGLAELDVSANAVFDIFADRNPLKSANETEAETEIMIWLGKVGNSSPLGDDGNDAQRARVTAGHVEFKLYRGRNQRGTTVFTWASETDQTSFEADVFPLLQHLWQNNLVSTDSHLGLVGFGTEAFHAKGNVTFSSFRYRMDLMVRSALAPSQTSTTHPPTAAPPSAGSFHGPGLSTLSIGGIVGALALLMTTS